jgi:hypothetical protein
MDTSVAADTLSVALAEKPPAVAVIVLDPGSNNAPVADAQFDTLEL